MLFGVAKRPGLIRSTALEAQIVGLDVNADPLVHEMYDSFLTQFPKGAAIGQSALLVSFFELVASPTKTSCLKRQLPSKAWNKH